MVYTVALAVRSGLVEFRAMTILHSGRVSVKWLSIETYFALQTCFYRFHKTFN